MLGKLPPAVAEDVMRGVINDWSDPTAPDTKPFLLKWVQAHPESTEGSRMADSLVRAQFESDATGQSALNLIQEITPGPVHDDAIATMSEAWSEKDPEAASKWVTTLPEGSKARDLAAAKLANKIQSDDPEGALLWDRRR
jgi:hypothetical protein